MLCIGGIVPRRVAAKIRGLTQGGRPEWRRNGPVAGPARPAEFRRGPAPGSPGHLEKFPDFAGGCGTDLSSQVAGRESTPPSRGAAFGVVVGSARPAPGRGRAFRPIAGLACREGWHHLVRSSGIPAACLGCFSLRSRSAAGSWPDRLTGEVAHLPSSAGPAGCRPRGGW